MAYRVNRTHFVFFRSVEGLTLSNLQTTFLIDATATNCPLTLTELGGGLYVCEYTPTVAGFYYLELQSPANNLTVVDTVEIDTDATFFGENNLVFLTQDYGAIGRFVVPTSNAAQTKILIYQSTDWTAGNTSSSYLVNSTAVDAAGNWLTPTLSVTQGTYTIVQAIAGTFTRVLATSLAV